MTRKLGSTVPYDSDINSDYNASSFHKLYIRRRKWDTAGFVRAHQRKYWNALTVGRCHADDGCSGNHRAVPPSALAIINPSHWKRMPELPEPGPVSLTVFHRNSNSMEISFHSHLDYNTVIATKFCTWHDSCAVVACAKICCDLMASNRITARRSPGGEVSIEFELRAKNR